MPRPRKHRKVCHFPENLAFLPENSQGEPVELTVDEYETIRLIDLQGYSQEECSASMTIARTTVQLIYGSDATFFIGNRPEGGVMVKIVIPLTYFEPDIPGEDDLDWDLD